MEITENASVAHALHFDDLWGNVTRLLCTQSVCQCCEKNAVWIVVWRDSATLEDGTASYGNVLAIPCGIKAESAAQRCKVQKSFPKL